GGCVMQTSYDTHMELAIEGQLADNGPVDVLSRVAESADVKIGLAVKQGSADNLCDLADDGDTLLGIVIHSHARLVDAPGKGDVVNVLRRGRCYVRPSGAVSAGDDVYLAGGGKLAASPVDDEDPISGAKWATSAADGELAVVEINLP